MLVVKSGRHPHEVLILTACLIYGLAGTFAYDAVAVTSLQMLPETWGRSFYILLTVGALVPLWGIWSRGVEGPLYERAGLLILSALNVGFAVSVAAMFWPRGLGFVLFNVAIAAANMWRRAQIRDEVEKLAAAAAAGGAADQLEGSSELLADGRRAHRRGWWRRRPVVSDHGEGDGTPHGGGSEEGGAGRRQGGRGSTQGHLRGDDDVDAAADRPGEDS